MIHAIVKIIVILLVTNTITIAQTGFNLLENNRISNNDSLIIERENGQKIKLIWDYKRNIHKHVPWKQLLTDFQRDFSKVSNNIPEYEYYNINYNTKSLVVDELVGKETFNVREENDIRYVKTNSCHLVGNDIKMIIEFNEFNELLAQPLLQDIETAVAQVRNKFYISYVTSDRHYFDVMTNSLVKPKHKVKLFIPIGVQLGILRNQPYVEFRPGLGVMVNDLLYFAGNLDIISSYNTETNTTEFDSYIGLSTGAVGPGVSSDFAIKVSSGIDNFEDIGLRAGLNYKTRNEITFGIQYYISGRREVEVENSIDFGFSIGIGF